MNTQLIILVLVVGILSGLRAFTPLALLCWAAHWNWIPLEDTQLAFLGHTASVIIFSLLALGELIGDKLPFVGNRTELPAFAARVLIGAFCGTAIFLAAEKTWAIGAVIGAVGAIIGTYGGFHFRRALVAKLGLPSLVAALLEDIIAIGGSLLVLSHRF